MNNFYEEWLGLWDKDVKERANARKSINSEELEWVRTPQDYKAALLVAPETGFKTLGGVTMLAEIPPGWKTGKHRHGEEAIYIIKGSGFSIINGEKYNWEEGACITVPFGATHQHFNTGDSSVEYFSALAPHFEYFCSIAKFEHLEDCGEYNLEPEYSVNAKDHDSRGRRIVLHRKDASIGHHGEERGRAKDAYHESHPHQMSKVQHGKIIKMMGGYDDFYGDEVEITDIFIDKPRTASEKHSHMEAILYMLQGEGYSILDGEKIPWKPGTAIHVQGPQTVHQHFITSDVESQQLRTHFGIRKFIQPMAKDVFPYLYFEEGRPLLTI
jgi:quercetin dioxygenase-like cupin family protein